MSEYLELFFVVLIGTIIARAIVDLAMYLWRKFNG